MAVLCCVCTSVLLAACGGGSDGTTSNGTNSAQAASSQADAELLASSHTRGKGNGLYPKTTDTTSTTTTDSTSSPTTTTSSPATTTSSPATTTSSPTTTTSSPTTTTSSPTTATTTTTTRTAPATTYHLYVATTGSDSNPGTQSAPFRTILKASQAAGPDTTIHVAPGNYTGGFQTTKSGTSSGRIYYFSDTKWGARIVQGSSGETAWDNRGAYVTIDGFDVDGSTYSSGSKWKWGIFVAGEADVVQNNHVHNILELSSDCTSVGGAGILPSNYYGGDNFKILNNVIHHVAHMSCIFVHPIYLNSGGEIKNNLIYASGGTSIHWWHDARNLVIANNTVFGSRSGPGGGGSEYYFATGPADNIHVANNIVFDNLYGFWEGGQYGSNITFTNNLSYGNVNYNWDVAHSHTGDVTADPQFANYIKTGGGDYHLKSSSPAIDKGTSTYAPSIDLDGVKRPQGAAVDIGAYEYK